MKIPISGVDLKKLIPQKDPIVMISSLETYQENALQSSFLVTKECIFIQDVELAETGLIEHMAQSVALHTGYSFYLQNLPAPIGYIGAIQHVEIHLLPKIGQTIYSDVKIIQEFFGVTLVEIITKLDGKIIAKAQMKTVIAAP